jgi:hypothetical protein
MSTLSVRIPESFHRALRALARDEGISINQIIASAVGEKLASLKTVDYLRERAARASRARFEQVLAKAGAMEPIETDRVADEALQPRRRAQRGGHKKPGARAARG